MSDEDRARFVVVGGGTAGWLSALYVRYKMPSAKVILVESDSIGILGAGEGTTPSFLSLIEELKIPLSRLVKETSTTIKNGIKFTNWTGDGSHYYHGFSASSEVGFSAFDNPQFLSDTSLLFGYGISQNKPFEDFSFSEKLSESNKVPFHVHPEYENQLIPDPIFKYMYDANYAVHFDAIALAEFLKTIAIDERNIVRVEGKVVSYEKDSAGDIKSITLDSGEEIEADFLLDCTGFAKKFIGESYESEWNSHSKSLTVNSAFPFFLPSDDSIPAYTESIAMKYGWVWKIPLQHRYGCGYVFDSNYLNDEDAKQEIVEMLGFEPKWPRESSFKFEPGYFKTPWVNNCLAVGLSSGFIEPLEATSIWATIISLREAFKDINRVLNRNDQYVEDFNNKMCGVAEEIFEFVYFHYMGGRSDTEFWKHYQDQNNIPERVEKMLKVWEYRTPRYSDFSKLFLLESWLSVGYGLGKTNEALYKEVFEVNKVPEFVNEDYGHLKNQQELVIDKSMDHKEFLEDLKSSNLGLQPL